MVSPEFYTTWKTHKDKIPPPLRPVTSQCDSPTERNAAVVNFILQQAMKFVSVNILNSEHLKISSKKNLTAKSTKITFYLHQM